MTDGEGIWRIEENWDVIEVPQELVYILTRKAWAAPPPLGWQTPLWPTQLTWWVLFGKHLLLKTAF